MSRLHLILRAAGIAAVTIGLMSCSGNDERDIYSGSGSIVNLGGGNTSTSSGDAGSCLTPAPNCGCSDEGLVRSCGKTIRQSGEYVACSTGEMTCSDGKWSDCIGDTIVEKVIAARPPSYDQQALGTAQPCVSNPCDPYCKNYIDNATGLDVSGTGLVASSDGLKIIPELDSPVGACERIVITPAISQLVVTGASSSNSNRLIGEYFNQRGSSIPTSWTPDATRVDGNIDFSWGNSNPGLAEIGANDFSVRWTGTIIAPSTGNYRFISRTDDGARLWINNNQLINDWNNHGPTNIYSAWIHMDAGVPYPFRMEYFENGGGAVAQLSWEGPGITKQIVPATAFAGTGGPGKPFTTVPEDIQFTLTAEPAGCYDGDIQAAWTNSAQDIAVVNNSGVMDLVTARSGPIQVRAYAGSFVAAADVNVLVDIKDTSGAPPTKIEDFDDVPTQADVATIRYPYDGTLFPLGMRAPLVQWDNGGTSAEAIKISLDYPSVANPEFHYEAIRAESSPGRFEIPSNIWKAFEESVKGGQGLLSLQRVINGDPRLALTRSIKFAPVPLRGKIYYTEYGRGDSHAYMMAANPGGSSTAQNVFSDGGCPVCHSVSANGEVFATSNRRWSSAGGISTIGTDGAFTKINDYSSDTKYRQGANDWRGFAWAPLTPDGNIALAANNMYGNSKQNIVGINTATRTPNVPTSFISGGTGLGLSTIFYSGTNFTGAQYLQTTPVINLDYATSTGLPGIGNNFSVSFTGYVQALSTESYEFQLTTRDGAELSVGGITLFSDLGNDSSSDRILSGSVALEQGKFYPITLKVNDGSGAMKAQLRWQATSVALDYIPQNLLYGSSAAISGVLVEYFSDQAWSNSVKTLIEPQISANWGSTPPLEVGQIDNTTFSSRWSGQLLASESGNFQICVRQDDAVTVQFNGTNVLSEAMPSNSCFSTVLVAGTKYPFIIEHRQGGGPGYLELDWIPPSGNRSRIPSNYLSLPSTFVEPTDGWLVSHYSQAAFNASLSSNSAPFAFQQFTDSLKHNWGGDRRPSWATHSSNDNFGSRYTALVQMPCSGMVRFEANGDADVAMWINRNRVISKSALAGSIYLSAGESYKFKLDYQEKSGNANFELLWQVACLNHTSYQSVSPQYFIPYDATRNGGGFDAGFTRTGGDNSSDVWYWIWSMPRASGQSPTDLSDDNLGNWGLEGNTMMVPSFSPDGTKLVFIDGDSGGGAGWRKGLSVFDFNQSSKRFFNRRQIVNTWPFGDVLKWPIFETDSDSIIYQTTAPGEFCCRNNWTKYGHMSPTNYYEQPGKLWSTRVSATTSPVPLNNLNNGELPVDRNKSYQATMLPKAVGGYRWVVFTSTRPYGNTLNLSSQEDYSDQNNFTPMLNYRDTQSQLWVAAIDDTPSNGTDRSYPAFWLPNQNYNENPSQGYVNERGFWALEGCRSPGTTNASICELDDDCCGGTGSNPTAVCRLDLPLSNPATRHCAAKISASSCSLTGGACDVQDDCCQGTICSNNKCEAPPPLGTYGPKNYDRTYLAECENRGTIPTWRFFDWKGVAPPTGSYIEFYAQSAERESDFVALPLAPELVSDPTVVYLGALVPNSPAGWIGADVGQAIASKFLASYKYVKITMRFHPSDSKHGSPVLTDWRQAYSCVDGE